MNKIDPIFKTKILNKGNKENYLLYKAALEWNLVDPIVVEDRKDFKSEEDWKDRLDPYHHQVTNLITFCRRLPVTLLADDVGLGKTISAGLIASELISRNRISKILIVCPKILMSQWKEELDFKFGIKSVEAIGRELLNVKILGETGAVITTYHSAKAYLSSMVDSGYQMLVLDEAHKLRNLYGTSKSPQVAIRFQKALADRMFKYVLMLTATPIHNRLWDIYSLVDLLATARGHENPFGSEGSFAKKFILDRRSQARKLVEDKKKEFHSIVYSYMYRTRRADVKLYFPERKVLLHRTSPTGAENKLIEITAKSIQKLNPLVQTNLLQALVSSPRAFYVQLRNMGLNGTVDRSFVEEVKNIVENMDTSGKIEGLKKLVDELKDKHGDLWRMVIFTERLETQTEIEEFFIKEKISCGLINGSTASRNQDTLRKFKKDIPDINVIISTRAGSEGVNLQVSNILVNYDLPWNPMIVEQRIGRIQRLASEHKYVNIFNIILKGTFEEYIVGRLMEKLQMASSAIGDIESLLEAAGVDEEEGFEEKIRRLVVDSLAGKDVKEATRLTEDSIKKAKETLKEEEKNINQLLGGSEDVVETGPRCPKLPLVNRSIGVKDFTLLAIEKMNGNYHEDGDDRYSISLHGKREVISFNHLDKNKPNVIFCKSGVPFFERLVTNTVNDSLHFVNDIDNEPINLVEDIAKDWLSKHKLDFIDIKIKSVQQCFEGRAVLRINITTTHDSYERLIDVDNCLSCGDIIENKNITEPLSDIISNIDSLGLSKEYLERKALGDSGVSEFCRFYQERLDQEIKSAGNDEVKRKKIENDFTPRMEITLVGLDGKTYRNIKVDIRYNVDSNYEYLSSLVVCPSLNNIEEQPEMEICEKTKIKAPIDCFSRCQISDKLVLKHLLKKSEVSSRLGLEEYFVKCSFSKKNILKDESGNSDLTNNIVALDCLKTSPISKKKAEIIYFDKCEFTDIEVLKDELSVSQISGKKYRIDQELTSFVSGKRGYKDEFIFCSVKKLPMLIEESEKCEVTGVVVSPGILKECEISGKRVMPEELYKCSYSGIIALKEYFVLSSISKTYILESKSIKSHLDNYCNPNETKQCFWTNSKFHPEDLLVDSITESPIYFSYISKDDQNNFEILKGLLDGIKKGNDRSDLRESIINKISNFIDGSITLESSVLSDNKKALAVCIEAKTWAGLKKLYSGFIFNIEELNIVGKVATGKRNKLSWLKNK